MKSRWHALARSDSGSTNWRNCPIHPINPDYFIGRAGDIDVYHKKPGVVIAIICSPERAEQAGRRHCYTHGSVDNGAVTFQDDDVVPTLHEMCLIYQLLGDCHDRNPE